jgi:hypothetical protein
MINRWFQEQILAYLDPDNAKALARLDSKSLEEEFQTVVQLLVDAPDDIRIDDGVEPTETLVEQISDRVTSTVINLFAPVLAKIESKLSRSDNETLSTEELLPAITRSDANVPIKRVVKHQGFEIGITHEKDAIRFPYSLPLSAGYGHIRRSYGAAEDKKAIDVYWGGDESATDIYRVRQLDPDTGFVAEHDYFMGFGGEDAPKAIRELYLRHLGQKRFGGLEKVNLSEITQYQDKPSEVIPEGHHWVKNDNVVSGGYIRRNWREQKKTDNETLLTDWDNLRYDSPNQDDWDDSDYIIDHAMQQSGKVFNRWLSKIQNWVGKQGSLENARDRIHELYQHLDGKQLTQVLEQGMTLANLSGRLAVVTESAENEEEADTGAEEES